MVKDRVAPPKSLLHVVTHIEKLRSIHSNRTISTSGVVKNWHLLTAYSYMCAGVRVSGHDS